MRKVQTRVDLKHWVLDIFFWWIEWMTVIATIVLRHGLVQGSGSWFWPDQFFFKSKRRRFSKKNKKNKSQLICNRVLTGSCRVNPPGQPGHIGFFLPSFFLQLGPVPVPGPGSRVDPPGQAGFQNYDCNNLSTTYNGWKTIAKFFLTS